MKPPKLLRTVYLRAIEVLKKRGWKQDPYSTPNGPVCVLVAFNVVQRGGPGMWPAHGWPNDLPYQVLQQAAGIDSGDSVGDWNDHRKRTKRQVIAALRKAAKLAGNKRVSP